MKIGGSNFRRIIFKDSLNFLPVGLSSLYETFSLENVGLEKKPFFPHKFNKMRNIGRKLASLPPIKYYCTNSMKKPDRAKCLEWHAANRNQPFDLVQSLFEYCLNDVQSLR